jgi:glycosyltransferase involved in cell wall biosynthesis
MYFEKPSVDLTPAKVIAVFAAHNEEERLPYFLQNLENLGVDHFLAVDNASTDNTREILRAHPKVSYFFTDASYADSQSGLEWTSELASYYCSGKWCLTLDVDEQLVYPGSEVWSLGALCSYLDQHGYDGLFALLLDMYHDGPLSEAKYCPGQPFLSVCDRYETATYEIRSSGRFPAIHIFGGPRRSTFFPDRFGPAMRKIPLVKWTSEFRYIRSTHACTPIRLADITGAVLHFEFFSSFKDAIAREADRNARTQRDDYAAYAKASADRDLNFVGPHSRKYENSRSLVKDGVAVVTQQYLRFMSGTTPSKQSRTTRADLQAAMQDARIAARIAISQLPVLWSMFHAEGGHGIFFARHLEIVGWHDDGSGLPGAVRAEHSDGSIGTLRGGADRLAADVTFDWRQRASAYSIVLPAAIFAREPVVPISVLADESLSGVLLMSKRGSVLDSPNHDGTCSINGDSLQGWASNPNKLEETFWLSVLVNGRFWRRLHANQRNRTVKEPGRDKHWFSVKLPEWLPSTAVIDVIIEGTNMALRRSPIGYKRSAPLVTSVAASEDRAGGKEVPV